MVFIGSLRSPSVATWLSEGERYDRKLNILNHRRTVAADQVRRAHNSRAPQGQCSARGDALLPTVWGKKNPFHLGERPEGHGCRVACSALGHCRYSHGQRWSSACLAFAAAQITVFYSLIFASTDFVAANRLFLRMCQRTERSWKRFSPRSKQKSPPAPSTTPATSPTAKRWHVWRRNER